VSIRFVIIVAAALAASACEKTAGQAAGPGGGRAGGRGGRGSAVATETTTVQRMSVQRQVDLSGTLLSPDQAKISSEVAGIIREVRMQLGTEVRAGDVLVRLEPSELKFALDRAESALRQVEAQLGIDRAKDKQPPPDEQIASVRQAIANRDDARQAFERAQNLNGRGLLTRADRDTAETRLKVTEANYQAALDTVHSLKASLQDRRASYELAQKKLSDAVIKAPIAGSISERLVQPGEFIRENTQVATIVQMSPLKLKTAIQEKNASLIHPGQAVEFDVEAFLNKKFKGKIAYVSPSVDQATRTFAVEAMVDNSDRQLKPGFFAKGVALTSVDEQVLAVPDDAVSTLAGVSTVYVIENGKARQQQITLGARQNKLVEVTGGLKGDEVLATANLNQLATGVSVTVGKAAGGAANASGAPGAGSGRGGRRGARQ
jgi:membrane fusion protein (multidrug efflux system)